MRFVGRVVGKREAQGRALVDPEVHEQKRAGEVIIPGTATVSLDRKSVV